MDSRTREADPVGEVGLGHLTRVRSEPPELIGHPGLLAKSETPAVEDHLGETGNHFGQHQPGEEGIGDPGD